MTRLVYDGCDPGSGEYTPNEFVIPVSKAREVAVGEKRGGKNGVITDCEKSVTTRFITIAEYFAIQRLRSRLAA